MCASANSSALRTSRTRVPVAGRETFAPARRDRSTRFAPPAAPRSARRSSRPPGSREREAPPMPRAPPPPARSRRGGDHDQLGPLATTWPDLGGEPRVVGGGADRTGDVGLVELLVGPRVDQDRAGGDRRPRPRAASAASEPRGSSISGPRLRATMYSTCGGRSPTEATVASTNDSRLEWRSAGLWRRSRPIVEDVSLAIPGLPHIDPPRWPGQTSTSSSRPSSRSCTESEDARRPLAGLDRPGRVGRRRR